MKSHSFVLLAAGSASAQLLGAAAPKSIENKFPSYAPTKEACPAGDLVRVANGLSPKEKAYIDSRLPLARKALDSWLSSTGEKFTLDSTPSIALAVSGGGYRSMLLGAGVVQGLDSRDSKTPVSGLYQALTYQSGLSGGSWLLAALAGNGWETVSKISKELWETGLVTNSLFPLHTGSAPEAPHIKADMAAKAKAGFKVTVTEVWGRFVAWQTLRGKSTPGTAFTMSDVVKSDAFKKCDKMF